MEGEVRTSYYVNKDTMAIFANLDPVYPSKILEPGAVIYCTKTPKQIVSESCMVGGSTLDNRRQAMEKLLNTKSKLPIPVNPDDGTFLFPTQTPRSVFCNWISFFHVKHYDESKKKSSQIHFTDDSTMELNMSFFCMRRQMLYTGLAIATFYKNRILHRS